MEHRCLPEQDPPPQYALDIPAEMGPRWDRGCIEMVAPMRASEVRRVATEFDAQVDVDVWIVRTVAAQRYDRSTSRAPME